MARAEIGGVTLAYEVVGQGTPWAITPGGRFSRDTPGVRELAEALAEQGNAVLIWDRPNCGESDVCFEGSSESAMQADALAGLLGHLDMTPAVITGGSGGARVSLLAAARHRAAASGVAVWWISGGPFGLLSLATHYCGGSLRAAWTEGMGAVAALDEWNEVLERNPGNRERILRQDPAEFVATMERWMLAYCPRDDEPVPGLSEAEARRLDVPALVFRSGVERPVPHEGDVGGAGAGVAQVGTGRAPVGRPRVARTPGGTRRRPLCALAPAGTDPLGLEVHGNAGSEVTISPAMTAAGR